MKSVRRCWRFEVLLYSLIVLVGFNGYSKTIKINSSQVETGIETVNRLTLIPGDSILFERGYEFKGELVLNNDGSRSKHIIISAYGDIEKPLPIVSGLTKLTTWRKESGDGIYSCPMLTNIEVNLLLIDGEMQKVGRWPNEGFLPYQSTSGNARITSYHVNSSIKNWTGAEVVIYKNNWIIDRSTISSHEDETIYFTKPGSIDYPKIGEHYGFFIQRDIRTLDKFGEWYFDGTRMYVHFGTGEGAKDPNSLNIEASKYDYGVKAHHRGNVTIENIHFTGQNLCGVFIDTPLEACVLNCKFDYQGTTAIDIYGGVDNVKVNNNTLSDVQGVGIFVGRMGSTNNMEVNNNTLSNIATIAGMGRKDGYYHGVWAGGANSKIQENRLENIGYNAISYFEDNIEVSYNFIKKSNTLLTDGGALYTWQEDADTTANQGGMEVHHNILIDCKSNGIYSDGFTNNLNIHHNVVINCGHHNVHMNEPRKNILKNNTFWGENQNTGHKLISISNQHNEVKAYGNELSQNTLYIKENQAVYQLKDVFGEEIYDFGYCDNNKIILKDVTSSLMFLFALDKSKPAWIVEFTNVQATVQKYGIDKNSHFFYSSEFEIIFNDSTGTKDFSFDQRMIDINGNHLGYSARLAAFESIIVKPDPPSTSEIELKKGWNFISFYLTPQNQNLEHVFSNLIEADILVKVIDSRGYSLEHAGGDSWTNLIGDISLSQGYRVQVKEDCILSTQGYPRNDTILVNLKKGWNIFPYNKQTPENGLQTLQKLISEESILFVIDEKGDSIYKDEKTNLWRNYIGNFKPNESYKLKLNKHSFVKM